MSLSSKTKAAAGAESGSNTASGVPSHDKKPVINEIRNGRGSSSIGDEIGLKAELAIHAENGFLSTIRGDAVVTDVRALDNALKGKNAVARSIIHLAERQSNASANILVDVSAGDSRRSPVSLGIQHKGDTNDGKSRKGSSGAGVIPVDVALDFKRVILDHSAVALIGSRANSHEIEIVKRSRRAGGAGIILGRHGSRGDAIRQGDSSKGTDRGRNINVVKLAFNAKLTASAEIGNGTKLTLRGGGNTTAPGALVRAGT